MTITQVMLNFRAALVALVPLAEQVRIPWRKPAAYDNWDRMALALFSSLVQEVLSLCAAAEDLRLPKYDVLPLTYADMDLIVVSHPSLGEGVWVFHAFTTAAVPFDMIEVLPANADGELSEDSLRTCPAVGVNFRVVLRDGGECDLIDFSVEQ